MNKLIIGLIVGIIAGIIDVIPMIIMKLSWDANISAFTMWVFVGVLISSNNINIPGVLKGLLISFMVLAPSAIIIGWKEPMSLIPIFVMTIILGSISGTVINIFTKNKKSAEQAGAADK